MRVFFSLQATKVSIEQREILTTSEYQKLHDIYNQKYILAKQIYQKDYEQR